MRSIKPGRGPSAMNAINGVGAVIFGILWTIFAFVITKDFPFPLVHIIFPAFGVVVVITGIFRILYDLQNATAEERFSELDITTSLEEGDPLNKRFGRQLPEQGEDTVESRLQSLENLRRKGLVSDSEYTVQRQRILDQI